MTTPTERVELRECPFCGDTKFLNAVACNTPWITCEACQVYGPPAATREQAIAKWNHRHPQPASEG